jgi:hypothetical protein
MKIKVVIEYEFSELDELTADDRLTIESTLSGYAPSIFEQDNGDVFFADSFTVEVM